MVDQVYINQFEVFLRDFLNSMFASSSIRLGNTDVALNCKFIECLRTAVATEVGADDFKNLMAFQFQAGFTFVQELEQSLFESWVENEGIQIIYMHS